MMTRNPRTEPRMAPSCSLVSTELLEVAWTGAAGGGGGGGSGVGLGKSPGTTLPSVTMVVIVVEALVRTCVITWAAVTWRSSISAMCVVLHNSRRIGCSCRGEDAEVPNLPGPGAFSRGVLISARRLPR